MRDRAIEDDDFRFFQEGLRLAIERYGSAAEPATSDEVLRRQRVQFEKLVALEERFRLKLLASEWADAVYGAFVRKVCVENKTILSCRPYFRERQVVCAGPITDALKVRSGLALHTFHFNSNFVRFALKAAPLSARHPLRIIAARIEALRKQIVETNMPLAINQAMLFWEKAPKRTADWRSVPMDFVQIAAEGLMAAVDKFVVPPAAVIDADPSRFKVWRAVAIGRMRGNFIEYFSSTTVHFFPDDRRKIYRANKHAFRYRADRSHVDFEGLARMVNGDLAEAGIQTDADELRRLMAAAVHAHPYEEHVAVSGHAGGSPLDRAEAGESWRPDVSAEWAEVAGALSSTGGVLEPADVKLLRLHGVDVESVFVEEGR